MIISFRLLIAPIALGILTSFGCGSSAASDPVSADLGTCVRGYWINADRACTCDALPSLRTPECDRTDCRTAWLLVLDEDGTHLTTDLRWSAQGGTVSTSGGVVGVRGAWHADASHLAIQYGEGEDVFEATCDGERLTREGEDWRHRPTPPLSASIDEAVRTDSWLAIPYSP